MKTNLNLWALFAAFILSGTDLCAQNFTYQWARSIDGTNFTGVERMVETANNDLIIAAGFRQTVDADLSDGVYEFTVTTGLNNIFLTRITANGDFIWAIHLSGEVRVITLVLDADENIYIAGSFQGTIDLDPGPGIEQGVSTGATDAYVAKYSPAGELIWAKYFGGTQHQNIQGLDVDNDGNIILVGSFDYTVDFDPNEGVQEMTPIINANSTDVFVVKWTGDGEFVWAKQLGGIGLQKANNMALDPDQNILITGYFTDVMDCDPGEDEYLLTPIGTNFTTFVVKLNSDAEFVWAQQIGNGSQDIGIDIKTDNSGNIYYAGHFDGTVDFNGGNGITELTAYGSTDVFISKLASDGTFLWASQLGGANTEQLTSMAVDADGNVYTTGLFQNTCDFDPSEEVQNITVYGEFDGFISVLNTDGQYLWAARFGNNFYDAGLDIIVTDQYIYELGVFAYGCYLDPDNPTVVSVTGSQHSRGFLAKYTHQVLGVNPTAKPGSITEVFPNPAQDFIFTKGIVSPAQISITDITGKTVLSIGAVNDIRLDVSALSKGVYVMRIAMDGIIETKKIVVQ